MNKKRVFGFSLMVGGSVLALTNVQITGAVIGGGFFSWIGMMGMLSFLAGGLMVLMAGGKGLEWVVMRPNIGWMSGKPGAFKIGDPDTPIVVDANYIIKASEQKRASTEFLTRINRNYDLGNPFIIPNSVIGEVKILKRDPKLVRERKEEINKEIKSKTLDPSLDSEWAGSRDDYLNIAKEYLNTSSKAQVSRYLEEAGVDGLGGGYQKYFKDLNEKISQKFEECLRKIRGKVVNRGMPLAQALKGYGVSNADTDSLAYALYLARKGRVLDGKEVYKVGLLSEDTDIEEALINLKRGYRINPTGNEDWNLRRTLADRILLGGTLKYTK
jgi:hypothetical protein